ncbi:hypothetical protein ACF068_12490 [Streptomyces sp. NPDC016309]|uniref:hypothetical protein n=1 Tax=Streptomyces sp. NPDC016309 TaxID=3364965 RepID=UPI0037007CFD
MSTTRRPLGTGPRPDATTTDPRADRGRTVAELAAELAAATGRDAPAPQPAGRRHLGHGPRSGTGR